MLAVAIVGGLALLAPTLRAARDTAERRAAVRVVAAVEAELRTQARRNFADFDAFAAATAGPVRLVASSDGAIVQPEASAALPVAEQFHVVDVARAATPAHAVGAGHVVLVVRVAWPYRGGAIAERDRHVHVAVCAFSP